MKKIILVLVAGLLIAVFAFYYFANEPIPTPVEEETSIEVSAADQLANKMLKAINIDAWDTIHYVQWSFRDKRHFVWDKFEHQVQVRWGDNVVLVDLNSETGVIVNKEDSKDDQLLIRKAIDAFNNDSFWLNAPAKVYDDGTERSIVDHEGVPALMVKYNSGGTTPGDSYLWILDENGLPKAWKMWVEIIPVGGMENTWEEWESFNGALISQFHKGEVFDLRISDVKTANSLSDLGINEELFADLKH